MAEVAGLEWSDDGDDGDDGEGDDEDRDRVEIG